MATPTVTARWIEPGGTFTVTATVRWDVTWAGAGQAGAFPGLTTTSTLAVRVIDIPALTTGGGRMLLQFRGRLAPDSAV